MCKAKVLACPEDCVEAFSPLVKEAEFELVSGPKEDVLARYCLVIRRYKPDRIIRATGDNPFVFSDAAETLNEEALALGADYSGYFGLPYGAGVESVNPEALLRAEREAQSSYERENVCPYLYGHPELFRLHRPLAPRFWQGSDMRVTVDTEVDFQRADILFNMLSGLNPRERSRGAAVIAAYRSCGL
jgi:spore coat polysaccharide biosynthesis protein SpsF